MSLDYDVLTLECRKRGQGEIFCLCFWTGKLRNGKQLIFCLDDNDVQNMIWFDGIVKYVPFKLLFFNGADISPAKARKARLILL